MERPSFDLIGANVQKRANGVLALMGYSVVPDLTSSSLPIDNTETGNPITQKPATRESS
ncbi:MAG: hypothetical protein WAM61_09065 [Desulfobacterales bacterium]